MAMKQTQTKLFDFSDAGLDFSPGSKNLFPDRFKKMLSLGYNVQTVTSVAIAGSQVTFTYGGAHGYKADRVIKIDSGPLSAINGGEFWIESVTVNTITLTIEGAPASISPGFTTRVAPLGWQLMYEQANIHVYKFKAIDESDLYFRICFQNNLSAAHYISPCIGRSFNPTTGAITDTNSIVQTKDITTPSLSFFWLYSAWTGTAENNINYSDGFQWFGKGVIVGSKYHFVSMHQSVNTATGQRLCGVFPVFSSLSSLHKAMIIGENTNYIDSATTMYTNLYAYCGSVRVALTHIASYTIEQSVAVSSVLPSTIEAFNTTMCAPINIYEYASRQFLGVLYGAYTIFYASTGAPSMAHQQQPTRSKDIDLNNDIFAQPFGVNAWWAIPVEEVKIA